MSLKSPLTVRRGLLTFRESCRRALVHEPLKMIETAPSIASAPPPLWRHPFLMLSRHEEAGLSLRACPPASIPRKIRAVGGGWGCCMSRGASRLQLFVSRSADQAVLRSLDEVAGQALAQAQLPRRRSARVFPFAKMGRERSPSAERIRFVGGRAVARARTRTSHPPPPTPTPPTPRPHRGCGVGWWGGLCGFFWGGWGGSNPLSTSLP